jgi:4-hydroxythreonine-4-phosphate dehydrogenase
MIKPQIGITMGDAAGIGSEIIVKAFLDPSIYEISRPVVIGDAKVLQQLVGLLKAPLTVGPIVSIAEAIYKEGNIDCIDLDLLDSSIQFGELSGLAGDAAYRYIEKAISLALAGEIDAICTAPINKQALKLGGHDYPGHTEILADLTGTSDFAMMFSSPNLIVVLVTIHEGLIEAVELINPQNVYGTINLTNEALHKMGYVKPRIAVCGINPHAGEGGLFGNLEEEKKIEPAIEKARGEGIIVSGPYPADTLFSKAIKGEFEAVIAMYHDQGLIPIKLFGIEHGVNITIGLPFTRTSVDHGTAFDIAGKGVADAQNMKLAIVKAAELTSGKVTQAG